MVLQLDPELEAALTERAQQEGVDPQTFVVEVLKQRVLPKHPLEPQDEWERKLLSTAKDYGVSLSNEALSSEGLYD